MKFLEELMEYLENNTTLLKREKNMFLGTMPPSITSGAVIVPKFLGNKIDYELPGLRKTDFQIAVRCLDLADGVAMMEEIVSVLNIYQDQMIGTHHVKILRPKNDYVPFPHSQSNIIELFVDFDAVYIIV